MKILNKQNKDHLLAIAVPPAEHAFWAKFKYLKDHFAIYSASVSADGDLVLSDCIGTDVARNPVFVALISQKSANVNFIKELKANARLRNYFNNAAVVDLGDIDDVRGILVQILGVVSGFLNPLAAYALEQAHALSASRKDFEVQHLKFSALETYIQQAGVKLVRQRMFVAPDRLTNGSAMVVDVAASAIRQLLPVSSKGVCAIDLLVRFSGGETGGSLKAALYLGDSAEAHATWVIPIPDVVGQKEDWITLSLPQALDGMSRSAILHLEVQGGSSSAVSLGASRIIANERYCPYGAGSGHVVGNRPIAMRIWQAPPGFITPRLPNVVLAEALPTAVETSCRVPPTSLQRVEMLLTAAELPNFAEVVFHSGEEQITVHPPQKGICIGVLKDLVPAAAMSVSAKGFVASERAQPVEFALVVAEADQAAGVPWSEVPQLTNVVDWSGWRAVAPTQPHQLSVFLTPEERSGHPPRTLFLLTRMEQNRSNAFAWARFYDVEIER
ncbi:DUF6212 domain-containing protein [Xanthobacter sp. VTT E-85241]|uniref:DUF6212 domain-containing protein n=1 Tax=Roseixanthobacter finlandensis TaxID=3119922 RepID=UPI00372CC1D5